MLQANPRLTFRDIRWVLASTAKKTALNDPSWSMPAQSADQKIGAFSPRMGFGLIQADQAVSVVSNGYQNLPAPIECTAQSLDEPTFSNLPSVAAIHVESCPIKTIEFVELSMELTHNIVGYAHIDLESPSKTKSILTQLHACSDCDQSDGLYWKFGSVRHLGEKQANGDWQIVVRNEDDNAERARGRIQQLSLKIYGF